MTEAAEALKAAAAREAVHLVQDGMRIGLGSGSTSELFLIELAARVANGLNVTAVPTSHRVAAMAQLRGIKVANLADIGRLDLAIDGADEIQPHALDLIKGRGGALLREKVVATAADRFCIIADSSKLVSRLGEQRPVPVAVVPFGWRQTADRIRQVGGEPSIRLENGSPLITDDGLYILDCRFAPIEDPGRLGDALKGLLGVVDHGLFVGIAAQAIVAGDNGIVTLEAGKVVA